MIDRVEFPTPDEEDLFAILTACDESLEALEWARGEEEAVRSAQRVDSERAFKKFVSGPPINTPMFDMDTMPWV
jgi:hypothetical protein